MTDTDTNASSEGGRSRRPRRNSESSGEGRRGRGGRGGRREDRGERVQRPAPDEATLESLRVWMTQTLIHMQVKVTVTASQDDNGVTLALDGEDAGALLDGFGLNRGQLIRDLRTIAQGFLMSANARPHVEFDIKGSGKSEAKKSEAKKSEVKANDPEKGERSERKESSSRKRNDGERGERKSSERRSNRQSNGRPSSRKLSQEKIETFDKLADVLASKVEAIGKPIVLMGLSSASRRAVHAALTDDKRVDTESQGDGYLRRMKIS